MNQETLFHKAHQRAILLAQLQAESLAGPEGLSLSAERMERARRVLEPLFGQNLLAVEQALADARAVAAYTATLEAFTVKADRAPSAKGAP